MDNANIELIRGHMDTIILRTLMNGDKYGLEIMNEIKEFSEELYSLKQSTLYNSLTRLKSQGLVMSYPGKSSNGAGRVYYKLTDAGRDFVIDDQRQWEFSRTIMDKLLSDKVFDPTINDKPFDPSELRPSTKRAPLIKDNFENIGVANNNVTASTLQVGENSSDINNDTDTVGVAIDNNVTYQQPEAVAAQDNNDKFHFSSEIAPNIERQVNKRIAKDIPSAIDTLYSEQAPKIVTNDYELPPAKASVIENNKQDIHTYDIQPKAHGVRDDADKDSALSILYASPKSENEEIAPQSSAQNTNNHGDLMNYTVEKPSANDRQTPRANSPIEFASEPPALDKNAYQAKQNVNVNQDNSSNKAKENVNYITSFGNIFNKNAPISLDKKTSKSAKPEAVESENAVDKSQEKVDDLYTYNAAAAPKSTKVLDILSDDGGDYEEMNFSKLKAKLRNDNITLKPYVKSNTTNYYVNRYFYSNKLRRDWSLIIYAIFALFAIISFSVARKYVPCSIGAFVGILLVGLLLPIGCFVLWKLNPTARKATTFSLSHSMITGLIVVLGMLMLILLISFFGIQVNVADTKTMILPIIIPLISLLLIPCGIVIYAMLYGSKKYHLR